MGPLDQDLANLHAHALELSIQRRAMAAFLSGSIVAGYGHANSDVDLYLVGEHLDASDAVGEARFDMAQPCVPISIAYLGQQRWDLELWLPSQVDELLARLPGADAARGAHAARMPTIDELDFLYRLSIARPVVGEPWLANAQARLSESRVGAYVAAVWMQDADDYVDDASGLLLVGDEQSAVLAARVALGYAIDAVCATRGLFQPSAKWRYRRVMQLPGVMDPEVYWRLESGWPQMWSRSADYVNEVLDYVRELIEETDLEL